MLKIGTLITLVTLLICINIAFGNPKYKWNKCMDIKPFNNLVGRPVIDCVKRCARSAQCAGISYRTSHQMCSLYASVSSLTSCTGRITLFKSDFPSDVSATNPGNSPVEDCGHLPDVAHSKIYGNMIQVGSVVKAQCVQNGGTHYVTCTPNGQWTTLPSCYLAVDCGPPPAVSNALPSFSTTIQGSVTTYTCNSGYIGTVPTSDMTLTCLSSGQWGAPSFSCQQVSCSAPLDVAHATKTSPVPSAGSSVTYTCLDGYISSPADATMTITCLNNGLWEWITFSCAAVDCGTPPNVPNTVSSFSSTLAGSVVRYTCLDGHTPSPSGTPLQITCLNSGQWGSTTFTCIANDCGPIPYVPNTVASFTSTLAGSVATYTCKAGYTTTSSAMSVTCLNSGVWDSVQFSCQQIVCPATPDVENSKKTFSAITAGSVASYTCLDGYTPSPSGASLQITCLNSGQWGSITFTCVVLKNIGDNCTSDSDCASLNGRCVDTQITALGRSCYCRPLYEYNFTLKTCVQVCTTYTVLQQYTGIYIKQHNVRNSQGRISMQDCKAFCSDSPSFDHLPFETNNNCYCNDVTYQQVMDGNPEYIIHDTTKNLYSWTC